MFRILMFREIVREQEKFMMYKNGERDYMVPISITRDRCKSLQTTRDRVMSLTFHLVTRSSKPKPFCNINLSRIRRRYYIENVSLYGKFSR